MSSESVHPATPCIFGALTVGVVLGLLFGKVVLDWPADPESEQMDNLRTLTSQGLADGDVGAADAVDLAADSGHVALFGEVSPEYRANFIERIYFGVVVYQVNPDDITNVDDYRLVYRNAPARKLLPNLAPRSALGKAPLDLFPSMDSEEGRAYWSYGAKAIEAKHTAEVGVTYYNGIPWYSAMVPTADDRFAIVFHAMDDPEKRDLSLGHEFRMPNWNIDAQVRFLDSMIETVNERVDRVEDTAFTTSQYTYPPE